MAEYYLMTTSAGSVIFDQHFTLLARILYDSNGLIKDSELLKNGKYTPAERRLAAKFAEKGKISYLGIKQETLAGIKLVDDVSLLAKASETLRRAGFFILMRKNTITLTKKTVKQSVSVDVLIVQAVKSLADIEKASNQLVRRLRDWYAHALPEFVESIGNNEKFAELIIKKDKALLMKEINLTPETSMGADLSKEDMEAILTLARQVNHLFMLRATQQEYLEKLMQKVCPNITAIAGPSIGAKLVELAGSLKKLSSFPASTIQVLGAEKALFNASEEKRKSGTHHR